MAKRGSKKDEKSAWYYYFLGLLGGFILVILFISIKTSFAVRHELQKAYNANPNSIINPKKFDIPILVYHYVEYVRDARDTIRHSLHIAPYVFENQVNTLKTAGYTFLTPKDINKILEDEIPLPKKSIILSFDDGYGDFYTDVFPLLKKYNVRAINYIISGFIDHPNYMTHQEVSEIAKSGIVELGCHTVHHPNLVKLSDSDAKSEIIGCHEDLLRDYAVNSVSFAYPYGAYNESLLPILKAAGFKNATTTKFGFEISEDNLYNIPRVRPGVRMGNELISYLESEMAKTPAKLTLKQL